MNIWKMIFGELIHRKGNFVSAVLSVGGAVACLVSTLTLLRIDQAQTNALLAQKQAAVEAAGLQLEDAMRVITKGLGFNVIILPEDQDLNELHLEGSLTRTMPESLVEKLSESDIVTVNHLLPTIVKKLTWPEHELPILVYGTRGEVPIMHRDPKKPLLDAVPRDQMIVGFEIAQKLGLKEGGQTTLMGTEFTIIKTHGQRGNLDDSTVWLNLKQAQEMFGLQNLIHAIQALECHCAGDRITAIRKEIAGILPGTQVIERGPPALARAEARNTAKETAEAALEREKASRAAVRAQRERMASMVIPVVLVASAMWIAFLAYGNVRERRGEVGVLRAIGYTSGKISGLFLGKFLIVALVGAFIGYVAGSVIGVGLGEGYMNLGALQNQFVPTDLAIASGLALFISTVGSWIPAMMAVKLDPAEILQRD
ncbi:MAG: FtsX-like permease family protein [Verrucomicrobia bacterium]|nr:FtsX-like permease family protein [Verrucomicrobiota bacterium]